MLCLLHQLGIKIDQQLLRRKRGRWKLSGDRILIRGTVIGHTVSSRAVAGTMLLFDDVVLQMDGAQLEHSRKYLGIRMDTKCCSTSNCQHFLQSIPKNVSASQQ